MRTKPTAGAQSCACVQKSKGAPAWQCHLEVLRQLLAGRPAVLRIPSHIDNVALPVTAAMLVNWRDVAQLESCSLLQPMINANPLEGQR